MHCQFQSILFKFRLFRSSRTFSIVLGDCRVTLGFVGLWHIIASSQFIVKMRLADNDKQPTIQTTTDTCSTPEAENIFNKGSFIIAKAYKPLR